MRECGHRFVSRRKIKNGEIYKAWRCYASTKYGQAKTNNSGENIGCTPSINEKF